MKNILYYPIIAFSLTLASCSESDDTKVIAGQKDPIKIGIESYLTDQGFEDLTYTIVDTVTHNDIIIGKKEILESNATADSMLIAMPVSIKEAEANLEKSIKDRDDNTSAILADTWKGLVEKNEEILASKKNTFEEFQKLKTQNDVYLAFMNQFSAASEGENSAFYIIECSDPNVGKKVGVTPSGKVFELP